VYDKIPAEGTKFNCDSESYRIRCPVRDKMLVENEITPHPTVPLPSAKSAGIDISKLPNCHFGNLAKSEISEENVEVAPPLQIPESAAGKQIINCNS